MFDEDGFIWVYYCCVLWFEGVSQIDFYDLINVDQVVVKALLEVSGVVVDIYKNFDIC